MKKMGTVILCIFVWALFFIQPANAFILINEILADPAAGILGDANSDGVTSSTQDEFVEILNMTPEAADLSGWSLGDSVKVRHIFGAGSTLPPYEFLVVFGGGQPSLTGIHWQIASSGQLHLTNTSDQVSLFNASGTLIDQVIYGPEGNHDQSLTRSPEGEKSDFFLHSNLAQANGRRFSPGTTVDGKTKCIPAVPESATLLYFGFGWLTIVLSGKTRKQYKGHPFAELKSNP